jgi:hypothetical protein
MTEASERALVGLRDLSTLEWYVVPLLAFVLYVYTIEIRDARRSGSWDAVYAGATLFGMDFINETWNGWVLALSGHSACWTAPGPSALRTMVGWNIEIMFMFAIAGVVFFHSLSDDPRERILGVPNRWFWAIAYSAFCVFVECLLNAGGLLVWEYWFWDRSIIGVWPIFFFGYFHFFVAIIAVLHLRSHRGRVAVVASMYGIAIVGNAIAYALGWVY